MTKVTFLHVDKIEGASLRLLGEYGQKFETVDKPPIPVEEILDAHLELSLGVDDLVEQLGLSDVLGATWVQDRRVLIDQSLDPTENPSKEGRYRFTVAHEVGHWELHRHLFMQNQDQTSLFGKSEQPSIVCRTCSRKEPIEWQADTFSGFLLMPKDMVFRAWESLHGSRTPYIAEDEMADLSAKRGLAEDELPTVDVARELAAKFNVSGQAMQIRLIGLGLIRTEQPGPGLFTL